MNENVEQLKQPIAIVEQPMNNCNAVAELRPAIRGRSARPDWRKRGWLSTTEYAQAIGRPSSTVRKWCQDGLIAVTREGCDYAIPVAELYSRYPHLRDAA